jgi:hypothetical protein
MTAWTKQGLIFSTEDFPLSSKLLSHASNPTPVRIGENLYRVFFSSRDETKRSSIGAFDFDSLSLEVMRVSEQPVCSFGSEESFFSHGLGLGNVFTFRGRRFISFMGWKIKPGEHWMGEIGWVELLPDLTLGEPDPVPLIGLSRHDPISLSYPYLWEENGYLHAIYGSTLRWETPDCDMVHILKYSSSSDARNWSTPVDLPWIEGTAQAFSRPALFDSGGAGNHIWFSYRPGVLSEKYKIGHAQSKDKVHWRLDLQNFSLDNSPSGWDSEMVEYPAVVAESNRLLMFYNGNGYGQTGIGLAISQL